MINSHKTSDTYWHLGKKSPLDRRSTFSCFDSWLSCAGLRWRGGAIRKCSWQSGTSSTSGRCGTALLSEALHLRTTGEDRSPDAAVPKVRDADHQHLCLYDVVPTMLKYRRELHDLRRPRSRGKQLRPTQDLESSVWTVWTSRWCCLCYARSWCKAWKYVAPTSSSQCFALAFPADVWWLAHGVRFAKFSAAAPSSSFERTDRSVSLGSPWAPCQRHCSTSPTGESWPLFYYRFIGNVWFLRG